MTRAERRRIKRNGPPEEVMFPVTPMLDMAFQLMAFFVLTFQAPTLETHLDLYLPAAPAALPTAPKGMARPGAVPTKTDDLENNLLLRAEADELGELRSLRLGEAPLEDIPTLRDRLTRYVRVLEGKPLRVRIAADDRLRYELAARLIAACGAAGVATVRLADPTAPGVAPSVTPGASP